MSETPMCQRCACNPDEPGYPRNPAAWQCVLCGARLCDECFGDPNCPAASDTTHRREPCKVGGHQPDPSGAYMEFDVLALVRHGDLSTARHYRRCLRCGAKVPEVRA